MKSSTEAVGWVLLVAAGAALGMFFLLGADPVWLLVSISLLGAAALTGLFGRRP